MTISSPSESALFPLIFLSHGHLLPSLDVELVGPVRQPDSSLGVVMNEDETANSEAHKNSQNHSGAP